MSTYAVNIPTPSIGQSTTCITCGIRLPSLETQQQHHKSDWHTYNLKRKMVWLPPVSAEAFAQLVNASREQANPAEAPQPECVPCSKKYLSFQAYENHLNSKKHKQTVLAYEKKQEAAASSVDKDSSVTPPPAAVKETIEQQEPSETVCLFCPHQATDAATNYQHMRTTHGFFLPALERLIDLPGLLTYLAEKLVENYDCLWCTPSVFSKHLHPDQELHAGFGSLASVRKHMIDKGHCKLAMEPGAEREYADFYLPLLDDQAGDLEEGHDTKESIGDSSMDADDSLLDEDQRKLNSVLLDEEGNWILDTETSAASGITIDPTTNELVLNKRRLTHKDAVRRQRLDARTGALTLRSQPGKPIDPHHPTIKASEDLLRSQNQLSGSSLALTKAQLSQVAVKTASAQHYESSKRERMATKLAVNNNISTRANVDSTYGFKV